MFFSVGNPFTVVNPKKKTANLFFFGWQPEKKRFALSFEKEKTATFAQTFNFVTLCRFTTRQQNNFCSLL